MSDEKQPSDVLAFPTAEVPAPAEAEAPPQPKGRCMKCTAIVDLKDAFRREDPGPLYHRTPGTRNNVIGNVCGPVMSTLIFQVWAKRQEEGLAERTFRGVLPAGVPPEENWGVLDRWESALAETDTGNVQALAAGGQATVRYVVERWQLVGAEG
jgi:hypothetical protein